MKTSPLEVLEKLNEASYEAYIVGGYVRDYLRGKISLDIDITTSAKPIEVKNVFKEDTITCRNYLSMILYYKDLKCEITSFRKEDDYHNNRHPEKIEYISNLYQDLLRRDFTMNTICMDRKGNIIDLLNGEEDIKNKLIKSVGDPDKKLKEDALRILRAVRFATTLDFSLDDNLKEAIINNKSLVRKLSFSRKKEELELIFSSPNIDKGIKLLKEFGLDKELEIYNLDKIFKSLDIISVWASLNFSSKYPFSKNERKLIDKLRCLVKEDLSNKFILYNSDAYLLSLAADMKNIDKNKVLNLYESLPIHNRKDIKVSSEKIIKLLNKDKGGPFIEKVYSDLENAIINGTLINKEKDINKYILERRDKYEG